MRMINVSKDLDIYTHAYTYKINSKWQSINRKPQEPQKRYERAQDYMTIYGI